MCWLVNYLPYLLGWKYFLVKNNRHDNQIVFDAEIFADFQNYSMKWSVKMKHIFFNTYFYIMVSSKMLLSGKYMYED